MQDFTAILINLDRDAARLEHMQRQLARANIVFTRQAGLLGDALPKDVRPFFYDAAGCAKTTMKRGEIGCYASHLKALMRAATGALGSAVLIMEDDLDIVPDLIEVIAKARQAAPKNWDILRLSSASRRAYVPVAEVDASRFLVRYSKIPNSAGAYLVTPLGAQKFLARGIRGLTFDDDLRRPWFHGMETYGILPSPVKPGVLKSTIDAIEPGRFDKGMSSRMERFRRGDLYHGARRLFYNMRSLGAGRWCICFVINIADMIAKHLLKRSIIDDAARLFPAGHRHA